MNIKNKKLKEVNFLGALIDLHTHWCEVNKLEPESADEMLFNEGLSESQIVWLNDFIEAWDNACDLESYFYNQKVGE